MGQNQNNDNGFGLTLVYIFCFVIAVLYLYFSCQAGSTLSICSSGLQLNDVFGLVCCSPVYLIYLVLKSGGLKFW